MFPKTIKDALGYFWKFAGDELIVEGIKAFLKKISGSAFAKVGEKIEKRVEEILLGKNTDEAKDKIVDETLCDLAVYSLENDKSRIINAFEAKLRETDSPKAEAFVLYVAIKIKTFGRDVKETQRPAKGQTGPSFEQFYTNFEQGVKEAIKFLEALIQIEGKDEEETFQERVAFLKGKNVFSLIPKVKPTPPIIEHLKKAGAHLKESQEDNLNDLVAGSENAVTNAKAFFEKMKARRRR